MALDKATIYATYQDDGAVGAGGQDSSTFPQQALMVFPNMPAVIKFREALKEPTGRKNPRITALYSEDGDEILLGCLPVIIIKKTGGCE